MLVEKYNEIGATWW